MRREFDIKGDELDGGTTGNKEKVSIVSSTRSARPNSLLLYLWDNLALFLSLSLSFSLSIFHQAIQLTFRKCQPPSPVRVQLAQFFLKRSHVRRNALSIAGSVQSWTLHRKHRDLRQ